MIELSPEQRQAAALGEAVRIVDPLTRDTYVLVRAEVFEDLAGEHPPSAPHPDSKIPPQLLRSQEGFWRALPELLKHRRYRKKWVAYHGEECVAVGRSDIDVYQECLRRELEPGEFYVARVKPRLDGIPPWGTIESDWSLYEAEDIPTDPA